jgi:hypothetical protein
MDKDKTGFDKFNKTDKEFKKYEEELKKKYTNKKDVNRRDDFEDGQVGMEEW